jgi:hypothetical protein
MIRDVQGDTEMKVTKKIKLKIPASKESKSFEVTK